MELDAPQSILQLKQCPACGYSLRGLHDSPRCPECGAAIDPNLIDIPVWSQRSKRFRRFSVIASLIVAAGTILAIYYFQFRMGCIGLIVLIYGGSLVMNGVRVWQIRRAQPNAVLLLGERDLAFAEHGKTLFTIPYENLVVLNLRPVSRRWRFKVTDRRWFSSSRQFECTSFLTPADGELLMRIISRRRAIAEQKPSTN